MLLAPIVEIFGDIDKFYKKHAKEFSGKTLPLPKGKHDRKTNLS